MHPPRSTRHPWRLCYVLLAVLVLIFSPCSANPLLHRCYYGIKYADNSAFQQSLTQVIRSLTATPPTGGYITTRAGETPDQVYGVAFCRGDVSVNDCQSCLSNGTADMMQLCPQSTDASVWYDHCYIRYSNDSFLGDPFGKLYVTCGGNGESNPSLFGKQLAPLMLNLTSAAATDHMFAAGEIDVTESKKIYGMVQCRRDLSGNDCLACLQALVYFSANQCSSTNSARVWHDGCNARYDIQPFLLQVSGTQPPSSSQLKQSRAVSGKVKIIIIAISAAVLVGAAGLGLCACLVKKRRTEPQGVENLRPHDSLRFDLDAIRAATNNFSVANRIGEGGNGPVYMGKLASGRVVAVKRLSMESMQGIVEFKNEVEVVASLRHKNLVQLLGYCADGHEKLLIYEFVPNTSLDKFIFDPDRAIALDWPTRQKIIGGIARGLLYIHEDSPQKIIHRNLKASNVLLDEEMNPKIADFGIVCARNSRGDPSQASTSSIAGTLECMAPECSTEDQISVKSDVYSYGILLLEIVSGRRSIPYPLGTGGYNLLVHAWTLWRDRKSVELVDPIVGRTCGIAEVLRCIQIALLCTQENPTDRPTMSSVLYMLSADSQTLLSPSPPSFFTARREPDNSVIIDRSDAALATHEAFYIDGIWMH